MFISGLRIFIYFVVSLSSLSFFSGISLLVLKQQWISSLQLQSLNEVSAGNIYVSNNSQLCYYNTVNWTRLFRINTQKALIRNNRDPKECSEYFAMYHSFWEHESFSQKKNIFYSSQDLGFLFFYLVVTLKK